MDSNNFSKSQKLLHLSQRFRQSNSVRPLSNPQPHPSESFKRRNRSAVLICLFEEGDDVFVILTKQSSKLSSYSGHVSLPGGRTDEGDTDDIANTTSPLPKIADSLTASTSDSTFNGFCFIKSSSIKNPLCDFLKVDNRHGDTITTLIGTFRV